MINIAVLGYGTVGSGVVEVIRTNHELINKRAGEEIKIKYVLDLREFPGDPVEGILVHDFEQIVNDPEVKIVVEVMGGTGAAYTFTKEHLKPARVCAPQIKLWLPNTVPSLWKLQKRKRSTSFSRQAAAVESRSFVPSTVLLPQMRSMRSAEF